MFLFLHKFSYENSFKFVLGKTLDLEYTFILEKTSAQASIALVGIQPKFKQVPPTEVFSKAIVFKPLFSDSFANSIPAGPSPIIATS